MKKFDTLTYAIEHRVATISLNRPSALNAISQRMRQELKTVIDAAEQDDNVRILVIRAEGRAFCSGTDLAEGLAGYNTIDEQIQQEYKPLLMGINQSDKLYIASIQGACVGIGAALAMTCDLAIMADNAYLYCSFAGIGLVPDGGLSHHLVNAMGYKKAMQHFVEAAKLPAQDCEQYGLVNKLCTAEELTSQTQAWAQALAQGAPLSQKYGKRILRAVHTSAFEQTLDAESKAQVHCSSSQDSQNAILAFFEKRKVTFTGR